MKKTGRVNLRLEPYIWEMLNLIAEKEYRSINNMIEVLIIRESKTLGMNIENLKKKPLIDCGVKQGLDPD